MNDDKLLDGNDKILMWTVHDIHKNDYDCNTGGKGTGDTGTDGQWEDEDMDRCRGTKR
jgi:hypothetical protein